MYRKWNDEEIRGVSDLRLAAVGRMMASAVTMSTCRPRAALSLGGGARGSSSASRIKRDAATSYSGTGAVRIERNGVRGGRGGAGVRARSARQRRAGSRPSCAPGGGAVYATASAMPDGLQKIVMAFKMVPDPMQRYKQLLYFAQKLPELPGEARVDDNKVPGCVSQVWVVAELRDDGLMYYAADSDSQLTKGLAALLVEGLSGSRYATRAHVCSDSFGFRRVWKSVGRQACRSQPLMGADSVGGRQGVDSSPWSCSCRGRMPLSCRRVVCRAPTDATASSSRIAFPLTHAHAHAHDVVQAGGSLGGLARVHSGAGFETESDAVAEQWFSQHAQDGAEADCCGYRVDCCRLVYFSCYKQRRTNAVRNPSHLSDVHKSSHRLRLDLAASALRVVGEFEISVRVCAYVRTECVPIVTLEGSPK